MDSTPWRTLTSFLTSYGGEKCFVSSATASIVPHPRSEVHFFISGKAYLGEHWSTPPTKRGQEVCTPAEKGIEDGRIQNAPIITSNIRILQDVPSNLKLNPYCGIEPVGWIGDAVNQVITEGTDCLQPGDQVALSFCSRL
ncbi:hypothetical protein NQ317_001103 [Molorchus minor]|uniref:Uncharacterized protein n=1 Tax=Molorchus minor TaxID=1323400 RepID=A0ABQ9IW85_9CUCU|nr:hypothetical protein NQ317_001103 [Molorchus minor]